MYVDRRDQPHWVYRCYDIADRLLYVGCTMNPAGRAQQHKTDSLWFQYKTRHVLRGPFDYQTARRVERQLINELNPYFNLTSEQLASAIPEGTTGRRYMLRGYLADQGTAA